MTYDHDLLRRILEKTWGKCHICHRRLLLRQYGARWHVDHSIPRASGGTDHLNNLFAACVECNCTKQDGSNRRARAVNGKTRAPLSRRRYHQKIEKNTLLGGCAGGVAGAVLLGPPGFVIGVLFGALAGSNVEVER